MKRIDTDSALPGGHFTNGNPDLGIRPTKLDASWFEHVQEELCGVIESVGMAVNPSRKDQLRLAFAKLIVQAGGAIPPGAILPTASDGADDGYVLCDGRLLSTNGCPELYAKIGNRFNRGIVPANTFRVPNVCGRVPVGAGIGDGLMQRTLAEVGGEERHELLAGELPAHAHAFAVPDHSHTFTVPDHTHSFTVPPHTHAIPHYGASDSYGHNVAGGPESADFVKYTDEGGGHSGDTGNAGGASGTSENGGAYEGTTANTGGNAAHNNMQPFLVVNYQIKLGVFDDPTLQEA